MSGNDLLTKKFIGKYILPISWREEKDASIPA
jgi:hypothetical protein